MGYISSRATTDFLARKLRNSDKAKNLSLRALKRRLRNRHPGFDAVYEPYPYQLVMILLCLKYNRYAVLGDMGVGKTKVVIDTVRQKRRESRPHRLLAAVPNISNVGTWVDQVREHGPDLTVAGATEGVSRDDLMQGDADVVVMTYAALMLLACDKRPKKKGKGNELFVDPKRIKALLARFDIFAADESTTLKNHQSLYYKIFKALAKSDAGIYLMTGTPFGRDPQEFWSQMFLVDGGHSLGETLGLFRKVFCTEKRSWNGKWTEYTFNPRKSELFQRHLRHASVRYADHECVGLPDRMSQAVRVPISVEQRNEYDRILEEVRSGEALTTVESTYLLARCISSGYIPVKGPDGTAMRLTFNENPKLDLVVDHIQAMPEGRKGIVFHEYQYSGEMIEERLKAEKIRFVSVRGNKSGTTKSLERFKSDPKVRVLILSNAAGAFGLNLQHANYGFFFESPTSPIIRRQAEKRIHRTGQKRHTFIYDFPAVGTVDMKIMKALAEGKDLFESIVEGDTTALEAD